MDARRARMLGVTTFLLAMALPLVVGPALAATCTLTTSGTAAIGTPIAIQGSGFPATAGIDVSLAIGGGATDSFTVQSDASGAFLINLVPEIADVGTTTVTATAGTTCSAKIEYTVLAADQTIAPTAAPEAAGGATPPHTDAALNGKETAGLPLTAWVIGILSFVIGTSGLIATRQAKRR